MFWIKMEDMPPERKGLCQLTGAQKPAHQIEGLA
jgi:hypothetical protein